MTDTRHDADTECSIADLLKRETADAHHKAETHPVQKAFVSGSIERERLAAFFHRLHAVLHAVETRLEHAATTDPAIATLREHTIPHRDRLATDLTGLDPTGSHRSHSPAVEAFISRLGGDRWSMPAIAGAFYVLEGSMNGNRFIRMAIGKRRPDLARHLSYLDPYGDEQRSRWQATRSALDRVAENEGARRAMLDAARHTFGVVERISDEVLELEVASANAVIEAKPTRRCPITGRTS